MLAARQILVIARFFFREKQNKLRQFRNRIALLNKGLSCSRNSIVNFPDISRISNGKNCSIGDFSIFDIADDPASPEKRGTVILGDSVYIGEQCNIRASGSEIRIGNQTMIANSVVIVSANHMTTLGKPMCVQPWETTRSGVQIGDDCWLGSNSTILPGSVIGYGSIIAAGAVVRGEIPPMSIWGGVPARQISMRRP
jgi:acetyltransferase-like isoleucine patch superfamily enzyme